MKKEGMIMVVKRVRMKRIMDMIKQLFGEESFCWPES